MELDDRPDLDGAPAGHRDPRGDGDRLVEILGFDHEKAAQLFPRLRKGTVGHEPPDAPLPDAVAVGAEPYLIVGAIAGG